MLVEDDPKVRRSLNDALEDEGCRVRAVADAESGLSEMAAFRPDLVISDIRMLGLSGLELLELIKERAPDIDVVLMTAFEDMPTVARAMREGASDFLVKPLELSKLRELILRVERDGRGRDEAAARSSPATGSAPLLVGRSPEILEVYKLIGRVAASRVTALIRGETGTGKELVARAIHESSAYAEEPFVPVNCTALPGTLLESELFGHVKGAFTGATSHRRGRFAMAQKGTIFLDEIGDTSPAFQSKLLRVLEDRIFVPVGAEEPQRTDARVLAATHRDLEALVARGSFREDLYYRLRVVELRVPPLRERLTDLPLLAQHFIQKASEALGCPQPELTDDATRHLLSHRWSGNVRELENCITLAATLATGGTIRPEHLELQATRAESEHLGPQAARAVPVHREAVDTSFPTLAEVELRHLEKALILAEGNKTRAAELLGVSKPRLYRMLKRLEEDRS